VIIGSVIPPKKNPPVESRFRRDHHKPSIGDDAHVLDVHSPGPSPVAPCAVFLADRQRRFVRSAVRTDVQFQLGSAAFRFVDPNKFFCASIGLTISFLLTSSFRPAHRVIRFQSASCLPRSHARRPLLLSQFLVSAAANRCGFCSRLYFCWLGSNSSTSLRVHQRRRIRRVALLQIVTGENRRNADAHRETWCLNSIRASRKYNLSRTAAICSKRKRIAKARADAAVQTAETIPALLKAKYAVRRANSK